MPRLCTGLVQEVNLAKVARRLADPFPSGLAFFTSFGTSLDVFSVK
jgi:hypothetical protein